MKLTLFAVVLMLACADVALSSKNWPMNVLGLIEAQGHRLMKRQSSNCTADISETTTQRFLRCSNELGSILGQDPNAADSVVTDFCTDGCGKYLIDTSSKLATDCDIPDAKPDKATVTFVNDICKHGPSSTLCGILWKNNVDAPTTSYSQCLAEFDVSLPCPDSCKQAESWVVTNIGCCYRAYLDYLAAQGITGGALTDSFWNSCGVKEPTGCTA